MTKFLPQTALSMRNADFSRTYHHVVAPQGTTVEDIARPAFWTHHFERLKPGDLVDAVADDGAFDLQLRVVESGRAGVTMRILREWVAPAAEANPALSGDDGPFEVKFAPTTRWRVIRKADRQELVRDLLTQKDAFDWLAKNVQAAA